MFRKEGHKIIVISLIIVVAAFLLIDAFITTRWIGTGIQIVVLLLLILILQFFRNPKRMLSLYEKHVVSPVDGKVVEIEVVEVTEFFKDKSILLSLFFSPVT